MASEKILVPITLLGKTFTIKCDHAQQKALLRNVEEITEIAQMIKQQHLALGFEQSLVAIALELAERLNREKQVKLNMLDKIAIDCDNSLQLMPTTVPVSIKKQPERKMKKQKSECLALETPEA